MHKLLIVLLLSTTYIFSHINAVVSIVPEQTFLKAIGGEKVNITLMVQAGDSPHSYEPKPSQMLMVAKADLYLAIGVEFEEVWLPKFQSLNSKMHVADISKGVKKIAILHDAHTSHAADDIDEHKGLDPHIWTSPANVKTIARNIYKALLSVDKQNEAYYRHNLHAFLQQVEKTDMQIKKSLSKLKGSRTFMVFHPSWGYFAKAYGLKEIAVEVEGKNPKPRELVALMKEAKEERVTAIFTQPEMSDTSAKILAKELHIPVVKITPLAPNWSQNLINIAKAIAGER